MKKIRSCAVPCSEAPLVSRQGESLHGGAWVAMTLSMCLSTDDRYWSVVSRIFSVTRIWNLSHSNKLSVSGNLTREAGYYRMCCVFLAFRAEIPSAPVDFFTSGVVRSGRLFSLGKLDSEY